MKLILWIAFFLIVVIVVLSLIEAAHIWLLKKQPPNLSDVLQADEGEADKAVADVEAELAKLPIAATAADVASPAAGTNAG